LKPTDNGKIPSSQPYSRKPEERAAIEKASERRKAPAPRLKVEGNTTKIDHHDQVTGDLLPRNSLGTVDGAFIEGLLIQLAQATSGGAKTSESELNFMVSVIEDIEPRDQLESMLAAQMATTHMAMMRFIQHLPRIESLPQQDAAVGAINKFARTFAMQMEALKRYRSGGEQKITVQHVTVSEGGQAIVGNVTQNASATVPNKTTSSPAALSHSTVAPMELVGERPGKAVLAKSKSRK
jgi:hypothetical protein